MSTRDKLVLSEENKIEVEEENIKSDNLFRKPDFIKPLKKKPALNKISTNNLSKNSDESSPITINKPDLTSSEDVAQENNTWEKSPSQKLAEIEIPIPYKDHYIMSTTDKLVLSEENKIEVKEENIKSDNLFRKPDFIKPLKKKPALNKISTNNLSKNSDESSPITINKPDLTSSEDVAQENNTWEKSPSQKLAEIEIPIPYKDHYIMSTTDKLVLSEENKIEAKEENIKSDNLFRKPDFIKPLKKKPALNKISTNNLSKKSDESSPITINKPDLTSSEDVAQENNTWEKSPSQKLAEIEVPIPYKDHYILSTTDKLVLSEENKIEVKEENIKSDNLFRKPDFIKPLKKKPALNKISTNNLSKNSDESSPITINKPDLTSSEDVAQENNTLEKSPSQKLAEIEIPIPYKEPPWSGIPLCSYKFEVIKNGVIIDNISIDKPFLVIGRLSNCDVIMEHPSISRFHCIIQYRKEDDEHEQQGLYVYDLESTHGTFQNKNRLQPKVFNRLKVGHMLKFGGSSRLFILQGPDEDEEPESDMTVTELKAKATEKKLKLQALESGELDKNTNESPKKTSEDSDPTSEGVDWGMGEDAVEEDEEEGGEWDGSQNPFSTNEELFLDDPKKTLRGWYEREGYDLPDYQVEELKPGIFKAKLELPVSSPSGKPLNCVAEHKGKKKDAVAQCALEACRILDRQGVLRQATHESHEKKRKKWSENDYYDSDEDDFLDRTGDIERKRKLRKKEYENAKGVEKIETYKSLKKQYDDVIERLKKLEADLRLVEDLKTEQESLKSDASAFSGSDDLEAYMAHLSSQLPDKHKRIAWKLEAVKLGKEEIRLRRLVNVTRPLGVTELSERKSFHTDSKNTVIHKRPEDKTLTKKVKFSTLGKVHAAFLEEEEEEKPKLTKLNCNDKNDEVVPVPYSKPQRMTSKYDELMSKEKRDRTTKVKLMPLVSSKKEKDSLKVDCSSGDDEVTAEASCTDPMEKDSSTFSEEKICDVKEIISDTNTDDGEDQSEEDTQDTQKRIIGPSLPSSVNSMEFSKSNLKQQSKEKQKKEEKKNPFDFEEKYETWVPPSGQTGDGRTSLNEKFGY